MVYVTLYQSLFLARSFEFVKSESFDQITNSFGGEVPSSPPLLIPLMLARGLRPGDRDPGLGPGAQGPGPLWVWCIRTGQGRPGVTWDDLATWGDRIVDLMIRL